MKTTLIILFSLCTLTIFPMSTEYNSKDYLLIQEGNLPLIITVSHGGSKDIPDYQVRQSGVIKKDIKTLEFAKELSEELKQKFGVTPYIVAALFSRKFIDANRSATKAFEDNSLAALYSEYHNTIKQFITTLKHKYPKGILLLDIHGQGREPLIIYRGTKNGITVKNFILNHGLNGFSGEKSIFGRLAKKGYRIFPQENELNTIPESTHFDGGFIVREYGKDTIDAIQVEIGTDLREKSECREQLVKDFSEILLSFLKDYYIPVER